MAASSDHVRIRTEPRITANELARFLVTSSPTTQLTIIRNSREALTPPVIRYKNAREPITAYLTGPHRDAKILHAAEAALKQRMQDTASSAFQLSDAALSLEAVKGAGQMANKLGPIDFQPAPKKQLPLLIEGVEVSINLNALVHGLGPKKKPAIGAALFRFTKADSKETEEKASDRRRMGVYAATLAYMHVLERFDGQDDREASPAHCYAIDFQCGDVHGTSASVSRRIDQIVDACKIIKGMWKAA